MAYKILFKDTGKNRREAWDRKLYKTKFAAQKEIAKAIAMYKGSKYVKDVKAENFKIVKVNFNPQKRNVLQRRGLFQPTIKWS